MMWMEDKNFLLCYIGCFNDRHLCDHKHFMIPINLMFTVYDYYYVMIFYVSKILFLDRLPDF